MQVCDVEYEATLVKELRPGLPVRFVRPKTLNEMQGRAGSQQDLAEIKQLELTGDDGEAG